MEWDDCFLGSLPLFHVFAAVGLQTVALLGRSPIVLIPNPRDIDDVVANIEKTRPTFLPGVPTLFIALLNHPKVKSGKVDMTSIKLCISGAAALMLDTKERFEAVTGGRIVEGYASDGIDDGGGDQPGQGGLQARLCGHAACLTWRSASWMATQARPRCRSARSARSRCVRRS